MSNENNNSPNFALDVAAMLITFIAIPGLVMLVLWRPLSGVLGTEAAIGTGLILQVVCLFGLRDPVANALKRRFGGTRK